MYVIISLQTLFIQSFAWKYPVLKHEDAEIENWSFIEKSIKVKKIPKEESGTECTRIPKRGFRRPDYGPKVFPESAKCVCVWALTLIAKNKFL